MENTTPRKNLRLTELSHGSGCGCKIAPADLEAILSGSGQGRIFPNLLVGSENKDDAAVTDLGDGRCIISTTDFFTPIVDDAFDFGRIAAANALSDVYAMGGQPLMAVAILGWPLEQLGPELAARVIEGARSVCEAQNTPLAGGHSIDSREPFFGLAVTGIVDLPRLKRNSEAREGDLIYLTKPLGTGILSTALKRGLSTEEDRQLATELMARVNDLGPELAGLPEVHAMTDVTGFGLLGHLLEMCEGAHVAAEVEFTRVPRLEGVEPYLQKFVMPDNTMRNFKAFSPKVSKLDARQLRILCDPQTNGGLLLAVDPKAAHAVETLLSENGLYPLSIGRFTTAADDRFITVN